MVEQRVNEIRGREKKSAERELEFREDSRLKESVAAFERVSGVQISTYNGEDIGKAVRAVLDGRTGFVLRRVGNLAEELERQAQALRKIQADFNAEVAA